MWSQFSPNPTSAFRFNTNPATASLPTLENKRAKQGHGSGDGRRQNLKEVEERHGSGLRPEGKGIVEKESHPLTLAYLSPLASCVSSISFKQHMIRLYFNPVWQTFSFNWRILSIYLTLFYYFTLHCVILLLYLHVFALILCNLTYSVFLFYSVMIAFGLGFFLL